VANPEYNLYHNCDAGKTIGVVFAADAVKAVELQGITSVVKNMEEYLGTLIYSKIAFGCGISRPELAMELKLSALSNTAATYPG